MWCMNNAIHEGRLPPPESNPLSAQQVPLPPTDPTMPPPGMPVPEVPPAPVEPPPDGIPIPGEAPPPPVGDPPAEKPIRLALPPEIGGPKGPEPTRYGDWEQKGRVTDF